MPTRTWTDLQISTLKEHYANSTPAELEKMIGKSATAIKARATLLGLRKAKDYERNPSFINSWPQEKIDQFKLKSKSMGYKRLAKEFGIGQSTALKIYQKLGLNKTPEAMERMRNSRFQKGHESWNKGLKIEDFMTPEQAIRFRSTQFQNGQDPHNTKFDGYESIRDKYVWVRVKKGEFKLKHRIVWEKHHGPIEKGMNIIFKNGNTLDIRIENLAIVSNEELMSTNSIHNYPDELKEAIYNLKSLRKIIKDGKEHTH